MLFASQLQSVLRFPGGTGHPSAFAQYLPSCLRPGQRFFSFQQACTSRHRSAQSAFHQAACPGADEAGRLVPDPPTLLHCTVNNCLHKVPGQEWTVHSIAKILLVQSCQRETAIRLSLNLRLLAICINHQRVERSCKHSELRVSAQAADSAQTSA